MKATTSSSTRIVWITGLVLVAGLALLLRQRDHARGPSADGVIHEPSSGKAPGISSPAKNGEGPPSLPRESGPRTSLTVDELVAIYEKKGAAAALAAAKGITGPDRDGQVVFILTYLAQIDPEWVAEALAEAGLSHVHQGFIVSAVMNHWKDGEKALAWASGFTGDLRKSAVGQALRILVRTNPEKATAYVEAMPESGNRSQALTDLLVSWGGHDPKAALAYLDRSLSPDERAHSLELVVAAWARTYPKEALAWIGTIQDKTLSARLIHEAALSWSSVSPDDASAWLATLPDDALKAGILDAIAERERNTIRCEFGSIQAPDQGWKNKPVAERTVVDLRNWATQDPTGARKHLEQASDGTGLNDLATSVAAGISTKEGPAAAFEWAQGLNAESKATALRLAVISWAGKNPSEAASAIEKVEPEQRTALASALVGRWSTIDPAAAAVWVANSPESDRKPLIRELLQQWSGSEPREAYAWLGSQPSGESRDEGISYMIVREASSDPASLVPWIEMLSTPALREEKRKLLDQYLKRAETE
ncbi:hypothetical protein OKA05_18455 [Luteolibacter arcticus]|uniref:HEAT repeat domain-containing protein n=1 Tax=Luteolibacter arcticus TaxID=1581411 RepID=A0ABT3GM13_9BACT|nr:hypothetical protein [Luteolibacter arcticus]MCW1924554.1 hypothetical protein [Luteolibacter arcticus]